MGSPQQGTEFEDGRDWPDWAFALMSAIHHTEVQILSKQDQLNADVQAIGGALTSMSQQLTDLKAQLAGQVADDVDLSALDALAAQAASLGSQVQQAAPDAAPPADQTTANATSTDGTGVAASDPAAQTPTDSGTSASDDPSAVNPPPTL